MPSQPQVLATILDSHSRLGSITDRLEKSLPRTSSYRKLFLCSFPLIPSFLYLNSFFYFLFFLSALNIILLDIAQVASKVCVDMVASVGHVKYAVYGSRYKELLSFACLHCKCFAKIFALRSNVSIMLAYINIWRDRWISRYSAVPLKYKGYTFSLIL